MGPLLFALDVDAIAHYAKSPSNVWYLDDATIGGLPSSVFNDLKHIIPKLSKIVLEINPSKCELINVSCKKEEFTEVHASIETLLGHRQSNRQK